MRRCSFGATWHGLTLAVVSRADGNCQDYSVADNETGRNVGMGFTLPGDWSETGDALLSLGRHFPIVN